MHISAAPSLCLLQRLTVLLKEFIDRPAEKLDPKFILPIFLNPQLLIQPAHRTLTKPLLQVLQKVARSLVAIIPLALGLALPMRRHMAALQPHPVRDALNHPTRTGAKRIMLEAVHELMSDDAANLRREALRGTHAVYIRQREVHLFVVVVELRARRVGDAAHVAQDEGDGAGGRRRGGRIRGRGVEGAQDVLGGGRDTLGEVERCEGAVGGWVGEVADFEAEFGEGEGAGGGRG